MFGTPPPSNIASALVVELAVHLKYKPFTGQRLAKRGLIGLKSLCERYMWMQLCICTFYL